MDSHRDEQMALGERGRVAHEALDAVVNADTFDEGAVRARAGELAIVDADMMVARARVYNEVLQLLTPDQRAQLTKRQAQMKERQGQMQQRQKERRDSGR